MSFTTFDFLFFLLAVLGLYHIPLLAKFGAGWQCGLLSVCSLVFYGWEDPKLLWLLGFSIVFNSCAGKRIAAGVLSGKPPGSAFMVFAVGINLLLLAVFKYAGLIGDLLLSGTNQSEFLSSLHSIPLPIGISFYTFHAVSFLVDLSRAGTKEAKLLPFVREIGHGWNFASLGKISLYINFFPQLVAGPIMKARDFLPQIRWVSWREIDWRGACRFLITGFFLKMVVADNIKEQTDFLSNPGIVDLKKLDLVLLLYGYSFRIFADFAGYSLIALGLASLFGYRLPVNFNYPYLASSVTEFWRRWHISLSNWLRDYLYFPLGGNRLGTGRTYFNLFLVMLLGGLWHGSEWRYALWGASHGLILAVERLLGVKPAETSIGNITICRVLGIFVTFNLVSWTWLLFAMPDMEALTRFLECVWSAPFGVRPRWAYGVTIYSIPVVIYHLWGFLRIRPFSSGRIWKTVQTVSFGCMLYLILTNSGIAGSFIYFQF